jgi:NAD(P)-dependent dehydrogenase (short-subunit alcohol dehydrogenase family)
MEKHMADTARVNIAGKRILLVGATGVLGRGYARAFVEEGATVAIADRPGSDVLAYADKLGCFGVEMDVASEETVVAGVAAAHAHLGGFDGVVNNAAATGEGLMSAGEAFSAFEEYPLPVWQKTLDVNLTGTFLVAREAGRAMKASGGGSLINVASIYGVVGPDHRIYEGQPFKSFPGYSASKAGVLGLTRWLATWWGREGIRVNCVTPGGVYNGHNDAFAAAYGNRTPMGRMANRAELVGIMVYLLSDSAAYCTGQNFVVDGGFTAW